MTRNYKNSVSNVLTKLEHSLIPFPQVTILGYHSVSNDHTIVDVTPVMFHKQLSYLERFFTFITTSDLIDFIRGQKSFSKPAVALTFDDGYQDILTNVYPILKHKHIPATLFVMSDLAHVNHKELANNKKLLTVKEIQQLSREGFEIGCHSATHANFADNKLDTQREIVGAKNELELQLGKKVKYFVYPKGLFAPHIVKAVKQAGYDAAISFQAGIISQKTNLFTIPRMPVDTTHSMEQFKAFFSHWGTFYLGSKHKRERYQYFHG